MTDQVHAQDITVGDVIESHDDQRHAVTSVDYDDDAQRVTVHVERTDGALYSVTLEYGAQVSLAG